MVRNWTEVESSKSSTWRELMTVKLALRSFAPHLQRKVVKVMTDNKGVVSIVAKGSMVAELHVMALDILKFCKENHIDLQAQWVPRKENSRADELSRIIDFDDWGVSDEFFQFVDKIWGPHTVDRFADDVNAKITRFNSKYWCPNTEAVDAFLSNWTGRITG